MADYRSAMEPDQIERELEIPLVLVGAIQWCHPPPGMYKPNWDAAIDTRNGKLGFGCTVRDIHGTVLAAFVTWWTLWLIQWLRKLLRLYGRWSFAKTGVLL
jgi:hypothetical protein